MRTGGRFINKLFILLLTGCFSLAGAIAKSETNGYANISVTINGIRNTNGNMSIGLYNSEDGWTKTDKVFMGAFTNIASNTLTYTFEKVPYGVYAVAIFHDENTNKNLDKSFLGIPKEGFGFSQNTFAAFGPPKFSDASFLVEKNSEITMKIKY